MTTPIEPGTPSTEALANWVRMNETLLNDLSSIFTVLTGGKLEPGTPAELARQLLSSSVSPQSLKDFRDYSVRLLSSLEGSVVENHVSQISVDRGGAPLSKLPNLPVPKIKDDITGPKKEVSLAANNTVLDQKGSATGSKIETRLHQDQSSPTNTTLEQKDGVTGSKIETHLHQNQDSPTNITLEQKDGVTGPKIETRLHQNQDSPINITLDRKEEAIGSRTNNAIDCKDKMTCTKTQASLHENISSPPVRKNNLTVSMAQTPRDPGLTIPQAMQKILKEVLHSINLLSSLPTEEKASALQLKKIHQKIATIMEELVTPIKGCNETDFASRDPSENSIKSAVKKNSSKESISIPVFEKDVATKKTLEDRTILPKSDSTSRDSSIQQKGLSTSQSILASPNKDVQVRPQTSEQTSISGAPFNPPITPSNSLRKEKKRRKLPWEREEYEEDEDHEKK